MKNILMNVEMTKAILDGRKVQMRRVVDLKNYVMPKITKGDEGDMFVCSHCGHIANPFKSETICRWCLFEWVKPKYQIGETIWVREPAKVVNSQDDKFMFCEYLADEQEIEMQYPERFTKSLPKWISNCQGIPNGCIKEMARIFLKITNVRVERLQDISDSDIAKEGVVVPYEPISLKDGGVGYYGNKHSLLSEWVKLWNKTASKGYRWEDNPYVFVYELERIENV